MSLVQKHGKEHISIASFGLTAVSNLIHTDSSKDKFGSLGEFSVYACCRHVLCLSSRVLRTAVGLVFYASRCYVCVRC
jgi:hypothetical protein